MKKLTVQDFQKHLKIAHPTENLLALSWNGSTEEYTQKRMLLFG